MTTDPREALAALVSALEEHLVAAADRRGEQDPRVEAAYTSVADAFEVYEDALYQAYDEVTPFELYDDVEDALDDDVDEDDLDLFGEDEDDDGIELDRESSN
ncbi:hypothetical protein [Spelaeicoccus albus]|uniref:Primosomal protein n=1 Tax=Spelaeicoccus albus TaxID=1280376 RepID=A0A7Z0D429_9MICO|nr:hypothetical protein [Spelaeicoccus albus]NYI68431.1 hypothetical protein [Spelaeicoccus albus]